MLADFQQALADLVASPQLCRQTAQRPELLRERYDLDDREVHRLHLMVRDTGMAANCILYRANRLTPIVLNLPQLCDALGSDLRAVLSAYWEATPTTHAHFLVEADRFRAYVDAKLHDGRLPDALVPAVREVLATEGATLTARLHASRSE